MGDRTCTLDGCNRPFNARGMCKYHYERHREQGLIAVRPRFATDEDRFWSKVNADGPCWEWTDKPNHDGYGTYTAKKDMAPLSKFAHRAAWQLLVGPVPDGLELDHLCKNRRCVSPEHLEPVPHAVNVRRGGRTQLRCMSGQHRIIVPRYRMGMLACRMCDTAERWAKALPKRPAPPVTHCKRGHEFTPENTYHQKKPNGRTSRQCRKCKVMLQRQYEARRDAKAA